MNGRTWIRTWAVALATLMLHGCGGSSVKPSTNNIARLPPQPVTPSKSLVGLKDRNKATDVIMTAFGLIDIGYRFGGANPDAGLDCSGLVIYVFERATGLKLPHNAAQIAEVTRPIERTSLRPADLVFFNTQNRPFSHVGLYIGDNRFVHAPNSRAKVKVSSLDDRYYAAHYEAARTVFFD